MTDGVGSAAGSGSASGVGTVSSVAAGAAAGIGAATGDFRGLRDIVEPASSQTFCSGLSQAPLVYADAAAVYAAWCSELAVSSTGTDIYYANYNTRYSSYPLTNAFWLNLGWPPTATGAGTYLLIGKGTGIHIYHAQPTAFTAHYFDQAEGFNLVYAYGDEPDSKSFFSIGAVVDNEYPAYIFSAAPKIRKVGSEIIGFFTEADSDNYSSNSYCTRDIAFRLRPGFIDFYATFPAGSFDDAYGGEAYMFYLIANESTNTFTGESTSFGGFDERAGLYPFLTDASLPFTFRVTTENDLGEFLPFGVESATIQGTVDYEYLGFNPILTETKFFSSGAQSAYGLTLSETPTQTPSASYAFSPTGIVYEVLGLQGVSDHDFVFSTSISQALSITEAIRAAYVALTSDSFSLTDLPAVVRGVLAIEQLLLGESLPVSAVYTKSVAQSLMLSDVIRRFFGGNAAETLSYSDTTPITVTMPSALMETLQSSDALATYFLLSAQADESVSLEPADVIQLVLSGSVSDTISIQAAHVTPDGTFTAWAVNTLTGGTTEYTNYEFNSFAQVGHQVVAASSSGLYELNGETDDGAAIIATLRSGYMQFGGSRWSSIKAAYMGIRGDGIFLVKLLTGDGKTIVYQVNAHNMTTTKINIGKGIRTRYIAFELESAGDDFDLENIEFIPLVASRRV